MKLLIYTDACEKLFGDHEIAIQVTKFYPHTNEATTVMAGPKYKMYNQVLPWKNSIPMHFHENIYLKLIFVKCLEYNFKRERNLFPQVNL